MQGSYGVLFTVLAQQLLYYQKSLRQPIKLDSHSILLKKIVLKPVFSQSILSMGAI